MYIVDNIVYAGEPVEEMSVIDVKIIDKLYLLITFETFEKRVFDCHELLKYPVYKQLEDDIIFNSIVLEHGIITWDDGKLDISTEKVYKMSYSYESQIMM